jgi:hypothetical protein
MVSYISYTAITDGKSVKRFWFVKIFNEKEMQSTFAVCTRSRILHSYPHDLINQHVEPQTTGTPS